MKDLDLYSFVFRGALAEESLDKEGRLKYSPEAIYFSEDIAKKLFLHEIDEKYVQQSKSMITVFTAITAFENATREFVYAILLDAYKTEWWEKGVQSNIKDKAEKRKENESKIQRSHHSPRPLRERHPRQPGAAAPSASGSRLDRRLPSADGAWNRVRRLLGLHDGIPRPG